MRRLNRFISDFMTQTRGLSTVVRADESCWLARQHLGTVSKTWRTQFSNSPIVSPRP